jgi:hypothetical protein
MTCRWYQVCPIKRLTDRGLIEAHWTRDYCLRGNTACVRFQMEAVGEPHPDNMMPDGSIRPDLPA